MHEVINTALTGVCCAWVATLLAWVWSNMVFPGKRQSDVDFSQGEAS